MSAATPPQKDHDIALPSCSKSVVNSDSLNNNQNCIIAQAPTITGPLLVTNNFFVGRDPSMISDQIVEEKSFGTDPAGYGEKGTNRTVGSSVETIEESEVPHAKCRIPKYLSRLPVNRENHLETREDSLRECNSISSTHTRRRLINVVPETRESIKLPIDFDESDSDAIQNYMRSNFFYRPAVIPLWTPSPIGANRQEILKKFNVCVGDVGYFTDTGGFHVLFNVFLPASANIALGFTPPDAFEPYGPVYCSDEVSDIRSIPRTNYRHCHGDFSEKDSGLPQNPQRLVRPFNLPGYFYRKCIASYHMEASKSKKKVREGSILDLPHGAWKDTLNVGTRLKLRIYLEDHGNDWYNHYLKQPTGPIIPEDSLKVVTGSYKCIGWALATCSTKSSKTISAGLYKTSETCPYYDWDRHDEVVVQTGPLAEETQGDKEFPPNQCVAVQVYSVTIAKTVRNATESFFESVKSSFTRGNTPNNSRPKPEPVNLKTYGGLQIKILTLSRPLSLHRKSISTAFWIMLAGLQLPQLQPLDEVEAPEHSVLSLKQSFSSLRVVHPIQWHCSNLQLSSFPFCIDDSDRVNGSELQKGESKHRIQNPSLPCRLHNWDGWRHLSRSQQTKISCHMFVQISMPFLRKYHSSSLTRWRLAAVAQGNSKRVVLRRESTGSKCKFRKQSIQFLIFQILKQERPQSTVYPYYSHRLSPQSDQSASSIPALPHPKSTNHTSIL